MINTIKDGRKQPVIKTSAVFGGAVVMMATRMGSLNLLEEDKGNSFWKDWLGGRMPSTDTNRRVFAKIKLGGIRRGNHHVYNRLKRNKAFKDKEKFNVLIVDGHESSASYLRCCPWCLERVVHTQARDRILGT